MSRQSHVGYSTRFFFPGMALCGIVATMALEHSAAIPFLERNHPKIWVCGNTQILGRQPGNETSANLEGIPQTWRTEGYAGIVGYPDTALLVSHGLQEGERVLLYDGSQTKAYAPVKAVYQIRNGIAVMLDFEIVAA